jgi:hypothetical protein
VRELWLSALKANNKFVELEIEREAKAEETQEKVKEKQR